MVKVIASLREVGQRLLAEGGPSDVEYWVQDIRTRFHRFLAKVDRLGDDYLDNPEEESRRVNKIHGAVLHYAHTVKSSLEEHVDKSTQLATDIRGIEQAVQAFKVGSYRVEVEQLLYDFLDQRQTGKGS